MKSNPSWFERNPKKTIAVILLVLAAGMVFSAEKILAYKDKGIKNDFTLSQRAIVLREYRPLFSDFINPYNEIPAEESDGLREKSYRLRIDKDGFIEPSARHGRPDLSLVFLGGSTTECLYVEEAHRFPYLAAVQLEKQTGLKINAYNAGRSGNNSLHSLDILLNKAIPLSPRLVMFMHNINDLTILLYEKSYWSNHPSRKVIQDINKEINLRNLLRIWRDRWIPRLARAVSDLNLRVKSYFKTRAGSAVQEDEFAHMRGKQLSVDKAALLEQFRMNLQTFIGICRGRKITPVLLTMANRLKADPDPIVQKTFIKRMGRRSGIGYQQYKDLFDSFNEAIRDKAKENGVLLIDLAALVPQESQYIYDVVHFNESGCEKAAQIIADKLRPLLLTRPASGN